MPTFWKIVRGESIGQSNEAVQNSIISPVTEIISLEDELYSDKNYKNRGACFERTRNSLV